MTISIRGTHAYAVVSSLIQTLPSNLRTIIGGGKFAPVVVSSPVQTSPYTTAPTAVSSQIQTAPLNLTRAIRRIKELSDYSRHDTANIYREEIESAYQNCIRNGKLGEFIYAMKFVLNSNPQSELEAMQWGRYRLSEAQKQLQQLS